MTDRRKYILLVMTGALLWLSCTRQKDPCLMTRTAVLKFGTYQAADTGRLGKDSTLPAPIIGMIDTGVLFSAGAKANKFGVLLSPLRDSTRFFIIPDSSRMNETDTIVFYYSRDLHFLSTSCGYTHFYRLGYIRNTINNIDSVVITAPDVNTDAKTEHVKIFY
jgi:hypothetical protein